MRKLIAFFGLVILSVGCSGGYSFTGGSVGEAKTIAVSYFPNNALLVNPNLSIQLTEAIKDIFVQQTPLELTDGGADMLVEGNITTYEVRPISAQGNNSAQGNETTSQSRFTIGISVVFTNTLEPEKSFTQRFSRYRDYSSDNLFAEVENALVEEINAELAEDIMNRAIANW